MTSPTPSFNYAQADEPTRRMLEKLIEEFDRNPDNPEAPHSFGAAEVARLNDVSRDIEKFLANAPPPGRERDGAEEGLRLAYMEAARGVRMILAAGVEASRRYREEYIPEASHQCQESQDPEDEIYLKDVMKCWESLKDRLMIIGEPKSDAAVMRELSVTRANTGASVSLEQPITVHAPLKLVPPKACFQI